MRCYVVSSALFVPGRIMAPFRLQREREELEQRQVRLQRELSALPARIEELRRQEEVVLSDFSQL